MFRELLTFLFPRTNRLGRPARRALWAAKNRPWLESLEDRLAPALLLVNSLADAPVNLSDAVVTLRDAIHAANNDLAVSPGGPTGGGADEIQFAGGLTGTITLNQGRLVIT
ncbi:MAG TPA: hypothetical protein VKE94_21790, partial [Gemmataceae bacterium]|nr:hypothetical protein [Gemmataceae bacterium]